MASQLGKCLPAQSNLTNLIVPHMSKCYPGTGSTVTDLASKDEYTFFSPDGSDIVTGGDNSLLSVATENASSGFFTFNRVHNSTSNYPGQRTWVKHSPPFGNTSSSSNTNIYPDGKIALNASSLILDGTDNQGKDPQCCMMIWVNVPNFIMQLGTLDILQTDSNINTNASWSKISFDATNYSSFRTGFAVQDYGNHGAPSTNNSSFGIFTGYSVYSGSGGAINGTERFKVLKDDWVCLFINRSRRDRGNQGQTGNSWTNYSPGGSATQPRGATANYYTIATEIQVLTGKYNSELQNKSTVANISVTSGSSENDSKQENTLINHRDMPDDLSFNALGDQFWGHVGVIAKWDRTLTAQEKRQAYETYKHIYNKPNAKQRTYNCQIIDSDGFPVIDSQNQSINTHDLNLSPGEFEIGL